MKPGNSSESQTENHTYSGEAELIEAIQTSQKDKVWWNKYFDIIAEMLAEFKIDGNSTNLSMSITKTLKMLVTIGPHYVIYATSRKNKVGLILPVEFEKVISDYKSMIDVSSFLNNKGDEEALWVRFNSDIIFSDDKVLFQNWKNAIKTELDKTEVSEFREFHNDFYYKAVRDLEYRKELLAKN
jgi:hypothetical protein